MKRALITGGTGFVGASLLRRLLRDGHEVHLIVRPDSRKWRIHGLSDAVRLHVVEELNPEPLRHVLAAVRPDWIFHLAVYGAYSWQNDPLRIIQTNVMGTINLLRASLDVGFESFVNTGSSSEYGCKDHPPLEYESPEPNSCYGISKLSSTLFCKLAAQKHRARIPTLRLYSVFGPFEEPSRLIPSLIQLGFNGRFPPLVDPSIAHDFVYIDDVVDAYLAAAQRPEIDSGEVFNIGTGYQTTLLEVVNLVRRLLGVPGEPQWGSMPNRSWDTTSWISNSAKAKTKLGWSAHCSLEDGLVKSIAWFRDEFPGLRHLVMD